jgi:hypothetical protein
MTDPADGRNWKHIAAMGLWLCLAPPVGMWKLWQDKTLSVANKWRVLIYLFVVPALLYATVSIWMTNQTVQRMFP